MRMTRRAAAAMLTATLLAVSAACAPPTPTPTVAASTQAANWLAHQFDPASRLIPSVFVPGTSDVGGSAQSAASLQLAGWGDATATKAVAALEPLVDVFVMGTDGRDLPGSLARLILAAESVHTDPHHFGGYDLVARLEATQQHSGPDAGRFGAQPGTSDGAFVQGLALAALSTVTPTPASIDPGSATVASLPAVSWLLAQQCADGSWMYRADVTTVCAFDPATYAGPDTNSTALAVMGLHAVGATPVIDPQTWLTAIRNADGGWSYDGSSFSPSDPDSTGLVMGALRALGTTPDAAAISALLSFQLGSSAPADQRGAFFYPYGTPTPNLVATNDALIGLSDGVWPEVLVD